MSRYVLAIDQGTTGTTIVILDQDLKVLSRRNKEFPQIYPKPGWVEHDPEDIWRSTLDTIKDALAESDIDSGQISAIGITNQRETTLLWDRETGKPVHNAIVWQCRRTSGICRELKAKGLEEKFRQRTGLVLDPYFSGTKLSWMLRENEDTRKRAHAGGLAFGTVDSFLVYRLTGGKVHVTDASNASRTLMMDLESLDWDPELLDILEVPGSVLPKVAGCSEIYGVTKGLDCLPDGIPIAGMAGDQQAALFGQACYSPGDAKCTFGTGAFVLMNTGGKPVLSTSGLLTTVAWKLDKEVNYALEGSTFIAGAAVQWLRDGLGLIKSAPDIEPLARKVKSSEGLVFVPAMVGLGAPFWKPEARGIIRGITRGTTAAHLARATLDGIALQVKDVLDAMEKDAGEKVRILKVDGGAAANDLLMQIQADVVNADISRPGMLETTAFGAAFLAGLATRVWASRDEIKAIWREERRFRPEMRQSEVDAMLKAWREALQMA
ncbi:MAG: glycerol kinase GlpK [Deltaproteobacteria bacterium]|nr:glycerol kinase GlpK [Deltaproteobacteria bacterium]